MSDLTRIVTGIINRDPDVLAEIERGNQEVRIAQAQNAADAADRKRRIATIARKPAVRQFRAANRAMNRNTAPIPVLYAADEAERLIEVGVMPEGIENLTLRMGAYKF